MRGGGHHTRRHVSRDMWTFPASPTRQGRAEAGEGFGDVFARVERADAEVAFAAGAEAAAGGDDDVGLVEQEVEGFPARHLAGCFHPDVGGVHPAVRLEAHRGEALADELRV